MFMLTRFKRRVSASEFVFRRLRSPVAAWLMASSLMGVAGRATAQAPMISSQLDRSYVGQADASICDCGQWTCPICQKNCPLGPAALPSPIPGSFPAEMPSLVPPRDCLPPVVPAIPGPGQAMPTPWPAPGRDRQCRRAGRRAGQCRGPGSRYCKHRRRWFHGRPFRPPPPHPRRSHPHCRRRHRSQHHSWHLQSSRGRLAGRRCPCPT